MQPRELQILRALFRMAALLVCMAVSTVNIRVSSGGNVTFLAVAGAQVSMPSNVNLTWVVEIPTPDSKVKYTAAGGMVTRWASGAKSGRTVLNLQKGEILAGAAPTADLCWVAGSNGRIYLLREGKPPEKIPPPVKKDLLMVKASDGINATVAAEDGQSFTTTDAGKTWKSAGWVSVPSRFGGMAPCPNC